MPDSISSVAVDTSTINTGIDGTTTAVTNETASSTSTSVAGIAAANSKATEATGIQDSYISSGQDQTITATEDATVTATAGTVTSRITEGYTNIATTNAASTITTIGAHGYQVGDSVIFTTTTAGFTAGIPYYVVTAGTTTTFELSATPGGTAQAATASTNAATATLIGLQESSASAFFSGDAGAITDTTLTDVDILAGEVLSIGATANNTATATATNDSGDAAAQAYLTESVGLQGTGVSAGSSGTITANVDGDAISSATTVGTTGATANATAASTAGSVIGIDDVGDGSGDFIFGTTADITTNVGTSADRVTVSATAATTTGNADANALLTSNIGISETVAGQIQVGTNGTIAAGAFNTTNASATTVTGTADADANITNASGIDMATGASLITGQAATVSGTANTSSAVVASATTGAATADSVLAQTSGAEIGVVSAGTSATITGTDTATLSASATSVDAAATAIGTNTNADAVEFTTFTSGTSAAVTGTTSSTVAATAASTDSNATATAKTTDSTGVTSGGVFTVGTSAALSGTASLIQTATATTVGDGSGTDLVTAQVGGTASGSGQSSYGLDLDSGATTIGTSGTISGVATATNTANATGTNADATSLITVEDQGGIDLGSGTPRTLSSGTSAAITAQSTGTNVANATTVAQDASSSIALDDGFALGDGEGIITTGTSASIAATASFTNTASATSTAGGDATTAASTSTAGAEAVINNDAIVAVDVTSITSGTTLSMAAAASSTQTANASNVGTSGNSAKNDATATVAGGDSISGIDNTTISVGTNTTAFTATANLAGSATSNTTFGDADSSAGAVSTVSGLTGAADTLTIGQDAVGGIGLGATTTLSALANTVWESATATVGGGGTSIGNDQVDITVGRDAGTIYASSTNVLSATAATIGDLTGADTASAVIDQTAVGTYDAKVVIGNDGNLTSVATTTGNARATNVGDSAADTDLSSATLTLDVRGLDQQTATTSDVTIGADGNVQSQAQASGSAFAQNVNGSHLGGIGSGSGAYALANLDVYGTSLAEEADITIGQSGNITGLAIVGTLNTGVLGNQVSVTSTTTEGTSYADGIVNTAGIQGTVDSTTPGFSSNNPGTDYSLLTAGPLDGDVVGQSITGMAVLANTIGSTSDDDASSSMTANIAGLQNVDILGGQTGVNLIKGTSTGDYDSTAISIKGDATAVGEVNGYGIFSPANQAGDIVTSGNIQAISNLLNTVVASSVSGTANATATTTAVGLGNYNITILGSGTVTANATGLAESTASSVAGRASS